MSDGIASFVQCDSEDTLARRMAAEYGNAFGAPSEYYVLKDQVERQPPGPLPDHDPLWGEPAAPVRPEETSEQSTDTWNFRDPRDVSLIISSYEIERGLTPSGSTLVATMQVALAAANLDMIPCPPPAEPVPGDGIIGTTTPKPGDVIWVGGWFSAFFDVDIVEPRGFLKAASPPTWYDMTLVRRSKYFPERKNVLPAKATLPVQSDAGTGEDTP